MAEDAQADACIERLLYILPAAGREGGATLRQLAEALGTTEQRISRDLEEVTARAYYHPGGWPDDVSILVEAERVRVFHARGFERPVRLSPRETLCLALALRSTLAASHLRNPELRLALLRRAERHLGAMARRADDEGVFLAGDVAPDGAGIRETLLAAARDRHPCAIAYHKPGADDMEVRVIHPYCLVHAGGEWYAVGWCRTRDAIRVFRLDRILEAAEADGTFEVPDDFDPADWVQADRVYRAEADVEVRVRYSPRIARWVRERTAAGTVGWIEEPDGSLVVRHRVADPHWVVSHALTYGSEAEILEPEELREMVRNVALRMAG